MKGSCFIVGPNRSGTTILAALLDHHPQVSVWPFEWRYFTEFFNRIAEGAPHARSTSLLEGFLPWIERFQKNEFKTFYSSFEIQKGDVDPDRFRTEISKKLPDLIDAQGFLERVFDAYSASSPLIREDRDWNVLRCMVKGFDWRNEELFQRSKFLFIVRPLEKRYASQRNKFIEKFHCRPKEVLQRCRRLFYEVELTNQVISRFKGKSNFLWIPLEEFRSDSQFWMKQIAEFLEIEYSEILERPTILGRDFGGHFHDSRLNQGGVIDRESNHHPPTSFEKELLDPFLGSAAPSRVELLRAAFQSGWFELDQVFDSVTLKERLEAFREFFYLYRESKRVRNGSIIDQSYVALKREFPYIQSS